MPRRKIFKIAYDNANFDPPAPVLTVYFSPPTVIENFKEIKGQIDTGADYTCVPEALVRELNLRSIGDVKARDFHNRTVTLRAYLAKVRIPLIFEDTIRVIGTNDKVALIGRDILNKLSLELDGTHQLLKMVM